MIVSRRGYRYVLGFLVACFGCQQEEYEEKTMATSYTSYVDPFIGTAAHGHTYPGATVPFGMVQLSPDNGTRGWDWCSGYHYSDSIIVGFSHTHLSGTGIGDLCDISFMPAVGAVDLNFLPVDHQQLSYRSRFSHDKESASPGYYAVYLQDPSVEVELTASTRAGFHRYTFPQSEEAAIILDLGFAINWDAPISTLLNVENDSTISGYRFSKGWAKDQKVFFAAKFSKSFKSYSTAVDSTQVFEKTPLTEGAMVKGKFDFSTEAGEIIKLKVGISSVSVEAARKSLQKEIPHWNFDKTREQADRLWEEQLSKISVETKDENIKAIFYTSLYRTMLAPVVFSDANREYKTPGGSVGKAEQYMRYDIFSLWDTFRAAHPLFTLIQQDRVNDMIKSLLAHYREYGLLPVWSLLGNETNTMTGYHAIPVITDAYFKGFRDYDVEEAFEAMKKSAMQDIRGTNFYREYNYIPYEKEGQSVTKTLEYAFDDWCIAQMAKALGKQEDYEYFMSRSGNYKNLFDAETGFMRARNADGSWKIPFDPKFSDHNFDVAEYTEGNAWQHSWFVPHDVPGLIDLHGSNETFIDRLDAMFKETSEIKGENASVDISGLIGQYAHGNEPSHHIAYLYNYAGAPWKTQEKTRQILQTLYTSEPDGVCGNEDCGQMSAWYVFSALGFYPVNPACGIYEIGSPLFEEATIRLGGGKTFTVIAENVSAKNLYVQSVTLNDEAWEKTYITHEDVTKGGVLKYSMGDQPSDTWGVNSPPYPSPDEKLLTSKKGHE